MDLLAAIKNNDELAFEEAFLLLKEKVLNYFVKKTSSQQDAEDLLQNTFLRLWRYRSSLNEDYLLDQHLFHIARTVFIDYTRDKNKSKRIESVLKTAITEDIESDSREIDKDKLNKILAAMPECRKKAFILHKVEGYSYKEIAELLSLNVKSVDNHVARALRQIRKAFLSFFLF